MKCLETASTEIQRVGALAVLRSRGHRGGEPPPPEIGSLHHGAPARVRYTHPAREVAGPFESLWSRHREADAADQLARADFSRVRTALAVLACLWVAFFEARRLAPRRGRTNRATSCSMPRTRS